MRYKLVISELTQYDYNGTVRDTAKEIYVQEIENLDIRAIIACANQLAAPLPDTPLNTMLKNFIGPNHADTKDAKNG